MRSGLTIVLLLAAALGVAGGDADVNVQSSVAPRLLAALLEQPSGMLSLAQLALPPAHKLLLQPLPAAACVAHLTPVPLPAGTPGMCAPARTAFVPPPHPACSALITRGP